MIPLNSVSYTQKFVEKKYKKCAVEPCYIDKKNKNEQNFIEYLEGNSDTEWWYKKWRFWI